MHCDLCVVGCASTFDLCGAGTGRLIVIDRGGWIRVGNGVVRGYWDK